MTFAHLLIDWAGRVCYNHHEVIVLLDIDFGKLVLTDEEKQVLRDLNTGISKRVNSSAKTAISNLKSLNFVSYYLGDDYGVRTKISDILYAVITDDGKRYLLYLDSVEKKDQEAQKRDADKEKRVFRHDWKIAIYSSVAGELLSRPIWAGIDWIAQFITSLLPK